MSNRQLFYIALSSAVFVIALHLLASKYYLYWTYRWVDIPMHILGGIMSGLFVFVFLRALKLQESLHNLLIGVFIIGIAWEILELWYKVEVLGLFYWLDTLKDLIDDTIGGLISIYIWNRLPPHQTDEVNMIQK